MFIFGHTINFVIISEIIKTNLAYFDWLDAYIYMGTKHITFDLFDLINLIKTTGNVAFVMVGVVLAVEAVWLVVNNWNNIKNYVEKMFND